MTTIYEPSLVRWSLVIPIIVTVFIHRTCAQSIRILAVVDADNAKAHTNLATAVEYINEPTTPILAGRTLVLDTVLSRDNDSFGAMDEVCTKIQMGVSVIVDMGPRYVSSTIRSLSEAMGITHISSVDPSYIPEGRTYNTSANVLPPSSHMLQVIRDIVEQENLTNVGIIYDETFDLDNKPKRLLRNVPAQHLYLRMATNDVDIEAQLGKIKSAELSHLFLASSANNAATYLGKANEKDMMTFKFNWYVVTKDAKVTCSSCQKDSTVTTVTGDTKFVPMNTYVQFMDSKMAVHSLDFTRENIEMSAAVQFDLINNFGLALEGLLASSSWVQVNYTDCYAFNATNPAHLAQAILLKNKIKMVNREGVFGAIKWNGNTGEPSIVAEIKRINFKGGSSVTETTIGNWTSQDRVYAFQGSITDKDAKRTYRVATIEEPPFIFKTDKPPADKSIQYYYDKEKKLYYYGYCVDLIYKINETMKFEFVLMEPEDKGFGIMKEDGSWTGLINELIKDRADIAVAPLSVMAERENVIDFTVPYYDLVGITILMKKPEFNYSVFKFMSVLETNVWICVFSAFIFVSILLALFDRYSPYSYQNNKESWDGQGDEPRVFTLKEGLWFCMTSLTPQGGGEAPKAPSGRLVAATWWMFGFIMIATYTANLAAFLTVSRLDQPIESLDDLAKQFKTKYAPQENTATETYFRRMADIEEKFYSIWKAMSLNDSLDQVERAKLAVWDYPVSDKFTNMWVSMGESGFPKTFQEAIERIKKPKEGEDFAFVGDATQNKYATNTDCDLWEVGEEFSRKPYALAVQEGSPLKSELSSVILQLLNMRFLEDLKTKWWEFEKKDCPTIEDESDGISIYNIGGVFLVILIGIGLGLLTLAFEYYWYKWRPAAKQSTNVQETKNGNPISNVQAHQNGAFEGTT